MLLGSVALFFLLLAAILIAGFTSSLAMAQQTGATTTTTTTIPSPTPAPLTSSIPPLTPEEQEQQNRLQNVIAATNQHLDEAEKQVGGIVYTPRWSEPVWVEPDSVSVLVAYCLPGEFAESGQEILGGFELEVLESYEVALPQNFTAWMMVIGNEDRQDRLPAAVGVVCASDLNDAQTRVLSPEEQQQINNAVQQFTTNTSIDQVINIINNATTNATGGGGGGTPPPSSLRDTTPPTLTVPDDMTLQTNGPTALLVYSVTARDDVDGTATLDEENTLTQDNNVGSSITISCSPTSQYFLPVGDRTVECSASDAANNTANASFTVAVIRSTTTPSGGLNTGNTITASANPAIYDGVSCPSPLEFSGTVTDNAGNRDVRYRFVFSTGATTPEQVIHFNQPGSQRVSYTSPGIAPPSLQGWVAIEILQPVQLQSNQAEMRIICAPSTGGTPPSTTPSTSAAATCVGYNATHPGTPGNDRIFGTAGPDVIAGLGGDDVIQGLRGDDIICGHEGNDYISGHEGDDLMNGHEGNDLMYGDAGNDGMSGVEGNDEMYGGIGNDDMYGYDGNDAMYGEDGNDNMNGEDGNDGMSGDAGSDFMVGDEGDDSMYGFDGNDLLNGGDPAATSGSPGDYGDGGASTDRCFNLERTINCELGGTLLQQPLLGNATTTLGNETTTLDTTPPTVTVPNNMEVETDNPSGTSVTYNNVEAVDNVDGEAVLEADTIRQDNVGGDITIACDPPSGSTFPVGVTTTVQCNAYDAAGNVGTASFTVTVTSTTPPQTLQAEEEPAAVEEEAAGEEEEGEDGDTAVTPPPAADGEQPPAATEEEGAAAATAPANGEGGGGG
jgi:Ca2+-binding RTX toxin-like protein